MSDNYTDDGRPEGDKDSNSINRRRFVKGLAVTGGGATLGTVLPTTASASSTTGSSPSSDELGINTISGPKEEQMLDGIRQKENFKRIVQFYDENGFDINFNRAVIFEVDPQGQKKYYAVDIPAETNEGSIERAAITAAVRENNGVRFEGTWIITSPTEADVIASAKVVNGKVELNKTSTAESIPNRGSRTTGRPDVTPQGNWIPDVDCSLCKKIAHRICLLACGVSLGTICVIVTGFLIRRACKMTAHEICETIDHYTDVCGIGAKYTCRGLNYC